MPGERKGGVENVNRGGGAHTTNFLSMYVCIYLDTYLPSKESR